MTSTRLQSSFFNKSYIMTQKLMLLLCCYLWSLTQGASIVGKALTECTTQPAKCLNLGQNWTSTYNDVNTRLGCNQRCIEHDLCTTWTWYEPCDSVQANNCILFESCSLDDQMCDNCYTGHNCR